MIRRRDLTRALGQANVSDWVVVERAQEVGRFDAVRGSRRSESRTRSSVVAHQDQPRGRGTVRLDVAAHANARELVDQAVMLATSAIGPAWKSTPPAAPAKVLVDDSSLEGQDLVEVAAKAARSIRPPTGVTVDTTIEILRETVTVQSRAGLDATWKATLVRAELLVIASEHSLTIVREARRVSDLALDVAVADAAKDLAKLAVAKAPVAGPCAIVLGPDAMLHGERGVWSIFASQADAILERQGLTRYKLGAPIVADAPTVSPPLTVSSDGSLAYATLSAPVGDDGDAIRKFTLVDRGVAVGLGLTAREAALRGTDPNGGIRNLVVSIGTWPGERPTGRTIEIRRLRALAIDPYTGDASLEIALGIDHDRGAEQPFTGGTVRLDLVAALATARRSATPLKRGSYAGPASLLIDAGELSS